MIDDVEVHDASWLVHVTQIPASFTSDVVAHYDGGELSVHPVTPFTKDYDDDPEEGPSTWPALFDVTPWRVLVLHRDGVMVAAAVLALFREPLALFDDIHEHAVLFDLRVAPAWRRRGVARALVRAAAKEAARFGADRLAIETQDVNVPALRLYLSSGAVLRSWLPDAYESLAETCVILVIEGISPEEG